ncbi:MAG: SAM-dependent methyltransferase [Pseudomonadota bacterium]|nr:SAM-dependent methyltransferase [Pseudomonadota bacterium]
MATISGEWPHGGPDRIGPPTGGLYPGIGLISAAALGYEILLMRLFSIAHWQHFAYIIISLALLGYGVSGTLITLVRERTAMRPVVWLSANALLFGMTLLPGYVLAMRVPFNGLEIVWNLDQIGWLALLYSLLAIPFLCAANCVGGALAIYPAHAPRVYGWDLAGAGMGVIAVVAAMVWFPPQWALKGVAIAGIAAGAYLWRPWRPGIGATGVVLCVGISLVPGMWLSPVVSEFKSLPRTLNIKGANIGFESFSPWGMLTAVENPEIPFRHAPGMSLATVNEPPAQVAVFTDGDGMTTITRYDGSREPLRHLEQLPSSLPYALLDKPDVLVLGAGGGTDVLQALFYDARHVDAVELNPRMSELVRYGYREFSGRIYERPDVKVHIAEARAFLRENERRYDLIQIALLDSFGSSSSGTRALDENYLYTVEAFQDYLWHLNDHGIVAVTRWLKLPQRDSLKLIATARAALEETGASFPESHLAVIRGWQTVTLLISRRPWLTSDLERIRHFADTRRFDLAWLPGMRAEEANRYNRISRPTLHDNARALLEGNAESLLGAYKFDISPSTDDRPYFSNFFRWRLLPELLELREQGALVLLDSGYLVLVAALAQAIPLAIVLILLPLLLLHRRQRSGVENVRTGLYFLLLGLAFMFIEMAYLQRFVMYTGHPVFAAASVLGSFLVFAGLGSVTASRLHAATAELGISAIVPVASVIALLGLIDAAVLPWLFTIGMSAPFGIKLLIGVLAVSPLAFAMGMPFPLGMIRLAEVSPDFIPWAWGINGCASVLGTLAAPLLAIHLGFNTVIVVAAALYMAAALVPWGRFQNGPAVHPTS